MGANYYTVHSFMRDELGLTGNALQVFAVIYSYSRDGKGRFSASREYLAHTIGRSEREIERVLKELLASGLITRRREHTAVRWSYSVAEEYPGARTKTAADRTGGPNESQDEQSSWVGREVPLDRTGSPLEQDRTAYNNKLYNKPNNKSIMNSRAARRSQPQNKRISYGDSPVAGSFGQTRGEYKTWAEEALAIALSRSYDDD